MVQRGGERLREQAGTGRLLAPVDDPHPGPTPGSPRRGRCVRPPSGRRRRRSPRRSVPVSTRRTARRRARRVRAARRARARWASVPPAALRRRRRPRSPFEDRVRAQSAAMRPPTTMQSPAAARRQPWVRAASDSNECSNVTGRPLASDRRRARERPASATQTIVEPVSAHSAATCARRSSSGGWRTTRTGVGSGAGALTRTRRDGGARAMGAPPGRRGSAPTPTAAPRRADPTTATRPIRSARPRRAAGRPNDREQIEQTRRPDTGSTSVLDDPAAYPPPVQRHARSRRRAPAAPARRAPSSRTRDRPR